MGLRVLWLVLALSGTGVVRSCSAYSCPQVCRCSAERFHCNRDTQLSSSERANRAVPLLILTQLPMKDVHTHSFKDLINITAIEISQSVCITHIRRRAFFSLRSVTQILVRNINSLRTIEQGAFTDLPRLEYLYISNTGVTHFPDFTTIASLVPKFFLEMADNMKIDTIPANSFQGITEEYVDMDLFSNGFKEIHSHAFNGTNLNILVLRNNKYLKVIEEDAFEGASGPISLDVSSTALTQLPSKGLKQLRFLRAIHAFSLKSLPPLKSLSELMEAELTYSSHCCAFDKWQRKQMYLEHHVQVSVQ